MPKLAILPESPYYHPKAQHYSLELGLPVVSHKSADYDYYLTVGERLALADNEKNTKSFTVQWDRKLIQQRIHQQGKKQLIARACGLHKMAHPSILDATAGFAQDAFLLANLGAKLTLLERSPILALLIADAIHHLDDDDIKQRFHFIPGDSLQFLQTTPTAFDVIYLDPMYPHRAKSALNKKSMRLLRHLVGDDTDAEHLLAAALPVARSRVVVKLPRLAKPLGLETPSFSLSGSAIRYDVYDRAGATTVNGSH
ncbi:MAG: class I SAM-dependent methyltransferase [Legionellales bacterium]|nr:class I SAM-dependent methyltransferase [Legionellales bacterium]